MLRRASASVVALAGCVASLLSLVPTLAQHDDDGWKRLALRRLLPATATFALAMAVLLPGSRGLPQHGDERMYVWKAGYYGARLARLDFSRPAVPSYADPGWHGQSFWTVEQPLGSHLVYALAMGLTHTAPPAVPYSHFNTQFQGPETSIPADTERATRTAAVVCAALGLGLVTARTGPRGLLVAVMFLALPHVRADLGRAWAEGPLLLGIGLCALADGSAWLAPACGLTASLKLTGLALWPLAYYRGLGRSRVRHGLAVIVAWLSWCLWCPTAWFNGGPAFLPVLTWVRAAQYLDDCRYHDQALGLYLPSRYLWPLELACLLALVYALPAAWRRLRRSARST